MPEDQSKIIVEGPSLEKPSAEDLVLMFTPDEDIWKRVHKFGYDDEECKRRLSSGDRWQQLIQAHLYLEHVIGMILNEALVNPSAIGASRMAFAQKLALVQAMGLLDTEVVTTIRKIASLRNKVAHDLSFSVTQASERELFNSASKRVRETAVLCMGREKGSDPEFSDLLYVVIWFAEVARHVHAYGRIIEKKQALLIVSKFASINKQISDNVSSVKSISSSLGRVLGPK